MTLEHLQFPHTRRAIIALRPRSGLAHTGDPERHQFYVFYRIIFVTAPGEMNSARFIFFRSGNAHFSSAQATTPPPQERVFFPDCSQQARL
jgi:hypothetical protein